MPKFNVQLPAASRQAMQEAKYWFAKVGIQAADLNVLRIRYEPVPDYADRVWVGLTFECGLRFYAVYRRETGGPYRFYTLLVELWRREQEGWEGQAPVWAKWQWTADEEELRKLE
jgi:hypothetical protein